MTEVALYSALYGAYEYVKPLPADLGCPAILYTDEPDIEAPGWEVRVVDDHFMPEHQWNAQRVDPKATWAMMAHKYWKCHPHEALPDVDVSLWVDASLLIYPGDGAGGYAARCLRALGDDDWVTVRHPYRDCIYAEAEFSATLARYDRASLESQALRYWLAGHPAHWGLFATGANVRRHTDVVRAVCANWWSEIVFHCHQDQVSLPPVFRMSENVGVPLRRNANMPWAAWWGVYEHGRPS